MSKVDKNQLKVKKYDENGKELAIRFGLGGIKAVGVGMMEVMANNRNENGKFTDIYDFAGRLGTKIVNKKSVETLAKSGAFDSIHSNRKQIFESCEIINRYASSKESERNSSQMSLFDTGSKVILEKPALKEIEDWNKEEKLQKEFEAFGFFVNQHPIDDYLSELERRGVISSGNLEDHAIDDNSIIKLAGVVAYSKHKSGPRGRYAYLTLSDPIGIYETSIFDEELITTSRDLMESGRSLVVECLLKKDDGGIRLLVKTIQTLDDFIKHTAARKEAYQDIKKQPAKNFNWKNKKNDSNNSEYDPITAEINYKRKIDELKNKKIIPEVIVEINNRDSILDIKSFLSQKLAPEEFEQFTKVIFLVKNKDDNIIKIELDKKYLLDKSDVDKIIAICKR